MGNLAAAHFAVLERIAQARPLSEVLGSIVDMVEAEADDVLCSILLYDARDGTLHHGAASRLPQPYVDAIDGVKAGPHEGSCGAAFRRSSGSRTRSKSSTRSCGSRESRSL